MPPAPALAHHSFAAEFDRSKPVTLTATIAKVESQNPHIYFYIDVEGHPDDPKVGVALRELREACAFFKVLGAYPIDVH